MIFHFSYFYTVLQWLDLELLKHTSMQVFSILWVCTGPVQFLRPSYKKNIMHLGSISKTSVVLLFKNVNTYKRVPADSVQGSQLKLNLKPTQVICSLCPELLCHWGRWLAAAAWASRQSHLWAGGWPFFPSWVGVWLEYGCPTTCNLQSSQSEWQQQWWLHPEEPAIPLEISRSELCAPCAAPCECPHALTAPRQKP